MSLLSLVNTNGVFSSTEINMRFFADDACLSYQHIDHEYLNKVINNELVKVDKWLHSNKLFINYLKIKCSLYNKNLKKL